MRAQDFCLAKILHRHETWCWLTLKDSNFNVKSSCQEHSLCTWRSWLVFLVQSLLKRTSTCPAGYTHVVWHVPNLPMWRPEWCSHQKHDYLNNYSCLQAQPSWPVHNFTSDLSMSTVSQSLCVTRGLYTPISESSGCSIHIMNVVTNNVCLFLALAA